MSDPPPKPVAIDEANAQFWKQRTLEELSAGEKPFTSWDDLDIPNLTGGSATRSRLRSLTSEQLGRR